MVSTCGFAIVFRGGFPLAGGSRWTIVLMRSVGLPEDAVFPYLSRETREVGSEICLPINDGKFLSYILPVKIDGSL
jgi:hypothetical protein